MATIGSGAITQPGLDQQVGAVRRFNRFFTRKIGVLREGLLHSPYSLAESRLLFELANRHSLTAAELCRDLGLDAGYVSRILSSFEEKGLVARARSKADGRQRIVRLTAAGRKAFALLDRRSHEEVSELLNGLSGEDQERLLNAMHTIETVLGDRPGLKFAEPFILRLPEPGDMGWVAHRHGVLYAQEYGWDATFEALVAQIVADFVSHFKPGRERCWIAEIDCEIVGSVFVVEASESVARLRLLLVEPKARGLGLGARLVEECLRFARRSGYKKMTLWTNSVLVAARRLYQKAGFHIVAQEEYRGFGRDLVGETWDLNL